MSPAPPESLHASVADLGFLAGAWIGDGFVLDFTRPTAGMMFGSMQLLDGARTRECERFQLVDADGGVVLLAWRDLGRCRSYRLRELRQQGEERRALFAGRKRGDAPDRILLFGTREVALQLWAAMGSDLAAAENQWLQAPWRMKPRSAP